MRNSGTYHYRACVPILDLAYVQALYMSGEVIMLDRELGVKLLIYYPFGGGQVVGVRHLDAGFLGLGSRLVAALWRISLLALSKQC